MLTRIYKSGLKSYFNSNKKEFNNTLVIIGEKTLNELKRYLEHSLNKPYTYLVINQGLITESLIINYDNYIKENKIDNIIAIGGGKTIDFAKNMILRSLKEVNFIVCPTTTGSGSEATSFAVLYKDNGSKMSISSEKFIPKQIIFDKNLVLKGNLKLMAISSVDAICQCLESLWSLNKTKESEELAIKGLELLIKNYKKYLSVISSSSEIEMLTGSNYSGRAINISKTTGAHAFSYYLTFFHKIPHGEAVCISFENFIEINFGFIEEINQDKIFQIFNCKNLNQLKQWFRDFKVKYGLLKSVNDIVNLDFIEYKKSINIERLSNNPAKINFEIFFK